LSPAAFQVSGPSLQMAVPSSMKCYAGDRNWFTVKVARHGFKGPLRVMGKPNVSGISVVAAPLDESEDSVDVEVQVDKSVPVGRYRLQVVADGDSNHDVPSAREFLDLSVIEKQQPVLRLTVSPEVNLIQGGKGKMTIRLARAQRGDRIELRFDNVPR